MGRTAGLRRGVFPGAMMSRYNLAVASVHRRLPAECASTSNCLMGNAADVGGMISLLFREVRFAMAAASADGLAFDDGLLAVVVAAGRSSRIEREDKTFAEVGGVPLVVHTPQRLGALAAVCRIALVAVEDAVGRAGELA